jgi:hypothetical protein
MVQVWVRSEFDPIPLRACRVAPDRAATPWHTRFPVVKCSGSSATRTPSAFESHAPDPVGFPIERHPLGPGPGQAAADARAAVPKPVAPRERKKQGMKRKKLTIVSLVAVPLIAGGGVVVAESAFAGTNGQRVQLCRPDSDYRSATLSGSNQEGKSVSTVVSGLKNECSTLDGYVWKGNVHIVWGDSPSPAQGTPGKPGVPYTYGTDCDVPVNSAQDPFPCYGPPRTSARWS